MVVTDTFPSDDLAVRFWAGNSAGILNGFLLNWVSSIKYRAWGHPDRSFVQSAVRMYQKSGGFGPFFKGSTVTVGRDTIFGGCFAVVQMYVFNLLQEGDADLPGYRRFCGSILAGSVATILSSPLNYVRNIVYATPPHHTPEKALAILRKLAQETAASKTPGMYLQSRLRIGWGIARIALGMAVSYEVYHHVHAWGTKMIHSSVSHKP